MVTVVAKGRTIRDNSFPLRGRTPSLAELMFARPLARIIVNARVLCVDD